jgi:hypothetical protein
MKVFISYRRADSQVTAGRMAQFLDAVPAVDEVFLDVDDIPLGEDFQRDIGDRMAETTHVLVLIGPQWRGPANTSGLPRLFDADDVVRYETRVALSSRARVVPILIDGTPMPRPSELPGDLKALPKLNGFALRTAHFDEDMDDLLDSLVGGKKGRGSRWRLAPLTPRAIALRVLVGAAAGGAVLVLLGIANRMLSDDCYDLACRLRQTLGITSDADALGLLWLTAIGVLILGGLAPFVPRALRHWRHRVIG